MKNFFTLCLAFVIVFALSACNNTAPGATEPLEKTNESVEETNEPTVAKSLDFKSPNPLGEVGTLTFVDCFSCEKLEPPMNDSHVYNVYTPPEGKNFVVLSATFTSSADSTSKVEDLFTIVIAPKDTLMYVPASYYSLAENGSNLNKHPSIDPLATQELYFAFLVDEGCENDDYTLVINDKEMNVYVGEFNVAQASEARPELKIGETISNDTLELTIEDVFFASSLYPPRASGYYHYYEAQSGKVYLIMKVTATNLKGSDMKYDSIAGVSCVYKEKYHYSSFCVFEEDGGVDLDHSSLFSIAPLDKGTCYYLMEVPEVVQDGPVTISVYTAGRYYSFTV